MGIVINGVHVVTGRSEVALIWVSFFLVRHAFHSLLCSCVILFAKRQWIDFSRLWFILPWSRYLHLVRWIIPRTYRGLKAAISHADIRMSKYKMNPMPVACWYDQEVMQMNIVCIYNIFVCILKIYQRRSVEWLN